MTNLISLLLLTGPFSIQNRTVSFSVNKNTIKRPPYRRYALSLVLIVFKSHFTDSLHFDTAPTRSCNTLYICVWLFQTNSNSGLTQQVLFSGRKRDSVIRSTESGD
jgi:hypothetical protein